MDERRRMFIKNIPNEQRRRRVEDILTALSRYDYTYNYRNMFYDLIADYEKEIEELKKRMALILATV